MSQQYDAGLIDREYAHYFPRLIAKSVTIDEIASELTSRNVEPHNVDFIVKQLKRDQHRYAIKKDRRWGAIAGFFASVFIVFVGVLIVMYTIVLGSDDFRSGLIALGMGLSGMATSVGVYVNSKG